MLVAERLEMKSVTIFLVLLMFSKLCSALECDDNLNKDVLDDCLTERLSSSDKALNSSYEKLKNKLSKERKVTLKSSQLAWLKYRENDCDIEASSLQGPGAYNTAYLACMIDSTNQRIARLNYLFIQF